MNWNEVFTDNYSVFDLETSGLSETLDHIIEVGLMEVRNDSWYNVGSWVVNPNFPDPFHVPAEITQRTGITDTEITYGADPRELFPSFIQRIRWLPVWGHNILRFDTNFIYEECQRTCIIPPPKNAWFDTAVVFKAWRLSTPGEKWIHDPNILDDIEKYDTFYDYGMYVLEKRIKGLYYNLPYCCETLGIDMSNIRFHRAEGDVIAAYRVREKLKEVILNR